MTRGASSRRPMGESATAWSWVLANWYDSPWCRSEVAGGRGGVDLTGRAGNAGSVSAEDPEESGSGGRPLVPPVRKMSPGKIVSGGQTGADRAALDWAVERGVVHGGWCPRGRRAEDGPIDGRYRLTETPGEAYVERTEWNVRDSDGTVIFSIATTLSGGSAKTADFARQQGKPWLHLAQHADRGDAARQLRRFVEEHRIRVLNVAGPRASTEPRVGEFVREVLDEAFHRSPAG